MLKQVLHDKPRELLGAERLIVARIRSFQDDKDGGGPVAGSLLEGAIKFLTRLAIEK